MGPIPTPERRPERLWSKTGGFGAFLQLAHNWADFENTKKSYEMYARYVVPHFRQANRAREASLQFAKENSVELMGRVVEAATAMVERHQRETEAKKQAS